MKLNFLIINYNNVFLFGTLLFINTLFNTNTNKNIKKELIKDIYFLLYKDISIVHEKLLDDPYISSHKKQFKFICFKFKYNYCSFLTYLNRLKKDIKKISKYQHKDILIFFENHKFFLRIILII
jgi:hypothetical protein